MKITDTYFIVKTVTYKIGMVSCLVIFYLICKVIILKYNLSKYSNVWVIW